MRLIVLVVLMFMVSGCSAAQWSAAHQGGMKAMIANINITTNELSTALRHSGVQQIREAGEYTGNHHAEYMRNQERTKMIQLMCAVNANNMYEYNSCKFANGIQ